MQGESKGHCSSPLKVRCHVFTTAAATASIVVVIISTNNSIDAASNCATVVYELKSATVARLHFDFVEMVIMLTCFCALMVLLTVRDSQGINGTVSGAEEDVRALLAMLRSDPRLAGLKHKESWANQYTTTRLKVRLKKEIVTLGVKGVDPTSTVGTYVKPKDWNALISQDDVVVIDTRNSYEVRLGTFRGALDPGTESFNEFPEWLERHPQLGDASETAEPASNPEAPNVMRKKKPKIAMFCTGGIRCEKASSYMLSKGYDEVYHLEGGILQYLEDVSEAETMWDGECYVFDRRVSVNHRLEQGSYDTCRACGAVLAAEDKASAQYIEGVACPACFATTSAKSKARYAERQRQLERAARKAAQGQQEQYAFGEVHEPSRQPNTKKKSSAISFL